MNKPLSFFLLLIIFLSGCSILPFAQHSAPKPFEGLVEEPIFYNRVYLKMQGNPRKPVVLLVHGLDDDASNLWKQTIAHFRKDYFLVTLDLPGFGKSAKANRLYSPQNYADLIHYLTQTYVKKPFHLVGHSMGGAISLRYAAMYPEDVSTLTLVDTAGILHRLAYTKYLAPLGLQPFSQLLSLNKNDISSMAGLILNTLDSIMNIDLSRVIKNETLRASLLQSKPAWISALALVLDDFSAIPQKIKAPTRLIWGEHDKVSPLRTGYVLDGLIEDSSLHIIKDAGHTPITQDPSKFYQLLSQSLKSNMPKSRVAVNSGKLQKSVTCQKRRYVTYKGLFDTLSINNCKDIYIQNAKLNKLLIKNSRVYLRNVEIRSAYTAMEIVNSTVEITSGKIQGKTAIRVHHSRLDIAGTKLLGKDKVISASTGISNAVFSLTPIENGQGQQSILHGQHYLTSTTNLFDR